MKRYAKLTDIESLIRSDIRSWHDVIRQAWHAGNRAGYGFPVGDEYDNSADALEKDGYKMIAEIDGVAVGTNSLNSIIAVVDIYGPWAVDITDALVENIQK